MRCAQRPQCWLGCTVAIEQALAHWPRSQFLCTSSKGWQRTAPFRVHVHLYCLSLFWSPADPSDSEQFLVLRCKLYWQKAGCCASCPGNADGMQGQALDALTPRARSRAQDADIKHQERHLHDGRGLHIQAPVDATSSKVRHSRTSPESSIPGALFWA